MEATGGTDATPSAENGGAAIDKADVIDVSLPATQGRTFPAAVVSLAAATGVVLLVPFVVLLIGLPIGLAVRGVIEAASWLSALIAG
jgi:hypothetical protein